MYRVVRFPSLRVSRPHTSVPMNSSKACYLCRMNNITLISNLKTGFVKTNMVCTRHYRVNVDLLSVNELTKRKRFRRDKKFFTEVLEVYGDTSSQTKAPVRNLKPGDVSRIAITPHVELDNFHKVKRKSPMKLKQTPSSETVHFSPVVKKAAVEEKDLNGINDDFSLNVSADFPRAFNTVNRNFSSESKLEDDLSEKNMINNVSELDNRIKNSETQVPEKNKTTLDYPHKIDSYKNHSVGLFEPQFEGNEPQNECLEHEFTTRNSSQNVLKKPLEGTKRGRMYKSQQATKDILARDISALEKMCKEKAFNSTLFTYLSLCVSCNLLHRGLSTLYYYVHRSKQSVKYPKITDMRIYEVLLRGFAAKGNQNKVNELWKMMASSALKPSLNMFASCLECAARSQKNKHLITDIIKSMEKMGFQPNDIFVNCTFLGDQREVILKAIQEVEPHFMPVVPPPSICYSCSLLQELNEQQGNNKNIRSPAEGILNKDQLWHFCEDQFNNEMSFYLNVKSVEKRIESEGNLEFNRQNLELMRASWSNDLKKGFFRDVSILEKIEKSPAMSLLPYLKVLDTQSYIDIMMKEIQRLAEGSESFSPSTFQLYKSLGNQVRNRYVVKFKKTHGIMDKTKIIYNKYCDWYLNPSINNYRSCNGRQEWQQLLYENQNGPTIVGDEDYWPSTILLAIGRFLYSIIISDVKIDVNILNKLKKQHMLPAFYRVYRQQGVKNVEEIKPHPVISKLYRAAGEEHILFDISLVPMLSPPLPWISYHSGGYLSAKTDLMRLPDQAMQQRQRLKEAPSEQLFPPLDSLNQLGSIPWQVNKPVLDIVIEVFNNGGCGKLEIPEPPYTCPMAEPVDPTMSKDQRYQAYRQRMLLRRQKAEMYSLWCDTLYKLSLANHFRDRIFWLPHNMDFRGRVYPCPPHLNHLGADMSRSLLCFAQGKPLGPGGLDWLKIHLVNLLGTKKRVSVQDRLDYAHTIMAEILDSAENPLTGQKWWMDSETPWQTLGCCMEIQAALQHPEGPENHISHFPIHQDGSCNGLQHYAALGRDEAGACSVNLMPQELPQDVYSCVAALVERERLKDSIAGVTVAKELDGFVRRKVIKQTVMTTVYGVTRFGARQQIAKQLKDIDSFPKECVWPASTYLVIKTFESLREMFKSTREIQDWFTECARLISQIRGKNMEYVTPLGLPVVQHYVRSTKKIDITGNKISKLQEYFPIDMFERPNVMKQKNAFPPNFIHSLDSSHMMLTSIFSQQRGITFVSVHDCYWSHASTVPIMNQICREQFVSLHSQPILENLSDFMLQNYSFHERETADQSSALCQTKRKLNSVLAQVPSKGTFILENVLDSIYFFS